MDLQSGSQAKFAPPSPTPLAPMTPPGALPIAKPGVRPPSPQAAPQGAAAPPTPLPLATGAGAQPYANATPNTPGSATDLTNKTIAPGAGVDRMALAKSNMANFRESEEPSYQADLREANQAGYGAGQGGSGMLRGRLGDIGATHDLRMRTAETGFLNDATSGSIDDNYRNIGIAQQQQGFQNDQQQQAFGQQMSIEQLMEMLRNGSFGRSATKLGMGNSGNPSDTALQLSGIYGKQASDAGSSAGDLLKNSAASRYLRPGQSAPQTPQIAGAPPEGWGPNGYDWMN